MPPINCTQWRDMLQLDKTITLWWDEKTLSEANALGPQAVHRTYILVNVYDILNWLQNLADRSGHSSDRLLPSFKLDWSSSSDMLGTSHWPRGLGQFFQLYEIALTCEGLVVSHLSLGFITSKPINVFSMSTKNMIETPQG